MSIQAGIWQLDGTPADRLLLARLSQDAAQFGPDGETIRVDGPTAMLYRSFHTTQESQLEPQPLVTARGSVITWDGRLDNRDELASRMGKVLNAESTDVALVAEAFDKWGTGCFSKLVGDWAICAWDPVDRRLTFAVDYMAVRHVYYYLSKTRLIWCSHLAPLVLNASECFTVDDEYVAGYMALNQEPDYTPYRQIQAVPPGHFARVSDASVSVHAYWAPNPKTRIRYKTDAEYEEHFRDVFRQSVRRRLRSNAPILAELSGGLDSSSIVCMADDILNREGAQTPRLDTLSYYDLSEPQGDDLPFLRKVQEKRGRKGHTFDVQKYPNSLFPQLATFQVTPGGLGGSSQAEEDYLQMWNGGGFKVSLSGVGGDEMLGGVPDPSPELADLIVQLRPLRFARRTAEWSLVKRRPWIQLAFQAALLLAPAKLQARLSKLCQVAPWMEPRFAKRVGLSVRHLGATARFGFWLPSRQQCAQTVALMSWQMAATREAGGEERRYPYLDQNFVEFLLAIPREQLLRPGERRSLMRRALAGIVPAEILARRTKATSARRPLRALDNDWSRLESLFESPLSTVRLGYFDESRFREAFTDAKNGKAPQLVRLLRALSLELWMRDMGRRGLIHLTEAGRQNWAHEVTAVANTTGST
jgi:asparagine synthase (glutamine-hydrolysing)